MAAHLQNASTIAFSWLRNLNAKIRDEPNENFAGERNYALKN